VDQKISREDKDKCNDDGHDESLEIHAAETNEPVAGLTSGFSD
jgi:hypothetical protein